MRFVALAFVVAASAAMSSCSEAEASSVRCRWTRDDARLGRCTNPYAVLTAAIPPIPYTDFSLLPDSGVGVGAECDGTVPTQPDGGTITFTRASSATCLTGDGVISALTTDQPAIQRAPYAAGFGAKGLVWETSTTNEALRSEAFDNAAWTATAAVTANTDVAPDGTTTGDTLTDSSAVAKQGVVQVITTTNLQQRSFSVFVKPGTVTGVTLTVTGVGASDGNKTCDIDVLGGGRCKRIGPASPWYRCACSALNGWSPTLTAISASITVGMDAADQGTISVWGAQFEGADVVGNWPEVTSYIPTTNAAATRAATTWYIPVPGTVTAALGCIGATGWGPRFDGAQDWGFASCGMFGWEGNVSRLPFLTSGVNGCVAFDGVNVSASASLSTADHYNAFIRGSARWTTAAGGSINAFCAATGGLGTPSAGFNDGNFSSPIVIGRAGAACASLSQGWMTDIRLDHTAGRCD